MRTETKTYLEQVRPETQTTYLEQVFTETQTYLEQVKTETQT